MNIHDLSIVYEAIEPLAFHRVIVLLRTDRNHEQTKTRAPTFICAFPVAVSTDIGSLDLLREVSIPSEHKSLLLSIVQFSRQTPRYFAVAVTICFLWGFLRCSFLKTGRARISLVRFTFLDNASRLPLFLPEFYFCTRCIWEFQVCPAQAFNPNSSTFRRIEFIGSESSDTQPWTLFFLRIATEPRVLSILDLALRLLLAISMSKKAMNATSASVSRLVTTTHETMPIITWRSFSSCPPLTRDC